MADTPDGKDLKKKTLDDADIVTDASEEHVGRRSALRLLGASIVGAAAGAVLLAPGEAQAQVTDSDSGPNSDPPGQGRGRRIRTGRTDRDPSDGPGYGVCALRGHTDSDAGRRADRPRRGRGPCR